MNKIMQLKEELKKIALEIRKVKLECKEYQRGHHGKGLWDWRDKSWTYRHMHIAYCLLRGRTMEQIERTNRENNKPDHSFIKTYMEMYYEEALHIDQA